MYACPLLPGTCIYACPLLSGTVIEADDEEEMPEQMLAGVYLTYLDPAKCQPFDPTLTRYLSDERNLMPPLPGSL